MSMVTKRGRGSAWISAILSLWATSCMQTETEAPESSRISSGAAALTNETVEIKLCQFSIFGSQRVDIRDRTTVSGGPVGSNVYAELGSNTHMIGDVVSGGNALLRGSYVDGNVTVGGSLTQQQGTVVTGEIEENASVSAVQIPATSSGFGYQNITVLAGQSRALPPGRYGTVQVYGNAALQLQAGTYEVNKFIVESSQANLSMDVSNGAIIINARQSLRIGSQTIMTMTGGDDPRLIQFYSASTEQVVIGMDMTFIGEITAPYAEVMVYSRVTLNGSIHARRVIFDTDGHVNGIGCLQGSGEYPLGADMMTRTLGTWWPDYRPDEVTVTGGIRLGIENMTETPFVVSARMKFFGPYGATFTTFLGSRSLSPDASAIFNVTGVNLPMRSETSAMQAQPELVINRASDEGSEIRTLPPIYFKHVPGTNFTQIELFDERTLIAQRGGKLAWGTSEQGVQPGEILGYVGDSETRQPIVAGQDERSEIYNELGEVVGYRLGSKLGE